MADDEAGAVSDEQYMSEIAARDKEVSSFLARKDKLSALRAALQNPPLLSKSGQVKDANSDVVDKVLNSISDSDINSLVEALDPESCDILMKYIYKFMSRASNCATVLKMHSVLTDKTGLGSIVRSMSDRKTV